MPVLVFAAGQSRQINPVLADFLGSVADRE